MKYPYSKTISLILFASCMSCYADSLDTIHNRGWVRCGIDIDNETNTINQHDEVEGFQANNCRALAVALFDDVYAVELVNLKHSDPLQALQDHHVDIAFPSRHLSLNQLSATNTQRVSFNYHHQKDNSIAYSTGAIVRKNDESLKNLVKWLSDSQILAEQENISSHNIESNASFAADNKSFAALFASAQARQTPVNPTMLYNVISKVGNYGEMFSRHIDQEMRNPIPRGRNTIDTSSSMISPEAVT